MASLGAVPDIHASKLCCSLLAGSATGNSKTFPLFCLKYFHAGHSELNLMLVYLFTDELEKIGCWMLDCMVVTVAPCSRSEAINI